MMKLIILRRLLGGIPFLRRLKYSFKRPDKGADRDLTEIRMALIKLHHPEMWQEADYILKNIDNPKKWFIPYPQLSSIGDVEFGFDRKEGLPYVVHRNKRLYFPATYREELCKEMYKGYIERECLFGGDYRAKRPHQYESEKCYVKKGDCLVDIGCAEAIFALEHIEEVCKAYLIEGDKKWLPALKATFKEYKDKVIIINKYISDSDSDRTISLKSIISQDIEKPIFIKMDIEGAEQGVLVNNIDLLKLVPNIKLAVCTYHRQQDAETFSSLLGRIGYQYEFSEGYTYIYRRDFNPEYPYFRHGVIRVWK